MCDDMSHLAVTPRAVLLSFAFSDFCGQNKVLRACSCLCFHQALYYSSA